MDRSPPITDRRSAPLVAFVATLAVLAGGCGEASSSRQPRPLRLVQVEWTESISMNHLVSQLVTTRLGRAVEVIDLEEAGAAFEAVAAGRADVFLNAWLPTTHAAHLAKYGPDLEDLGPIYSGAQIGLVVDADSPLESIGDLKDHPDLLPEKMIGLDTDSGVLKATEAAARAYGLDFQVGETGHEELDEYIRRSLEQRGGVLFAGWRPHRRFRKQALRFLADPKGVYGGAEEIRVVAHRGFSEEMPRVAALLRGIEFDTASFEDLLDTVQSKKAETAARVETWRIAEAARLEEWFAEVPPPPGR